MILLGTGRRRRRSIAVAVIGAVTLAAGTLLAPGALAGSQPTATAGGTRRFEFRDGSSAKFWEVSQSAGDVAVRFGRIGTSGQSQTKSFADPVAGKKHADELVAEKTAKGYVQAS